MASQRECEEEHEGREQQDGSREYRHHDGDHRVVRAAAWSTVNPGSSVGHRATAQSAMTSATASAAV